MTRQPWSSTEIETLRSLYPTTSTAELARGLKRPIHKVYAKARNLGLSKTEEFLASPESGRLRKGQSRPGTEHTQFKRGHVPANKGLRRPGWTAGRMRETQFKKGDRMGIAATNWKPIGTILADPEGYLRIKVREAVHGIVRPFLAPEDREGFADSRIQGFRGHLRRVRNPFHVRDRDLAGHQLGHAPRITIFAIHSPTIPGGNSHDACR